MIFGNFHDQPILPKYYDLLNDNDDDKNNIAGTPVYDVFPDKKLVKYSVVPNAPNADANDKDIDYDTIIDDDDSLTSNIEPPQEEMTEIEGVDA